jgi:Fe2+ transport system protein FeoA
MGLTPGVSVRVVAHAPLGDPLELEVRGYRLSLRRSDAARVAVSAP